MRLFLKFTLVSIVTVIIIVSGFLAIKSGDLLINYLSNSLGFRTVYTNNCGFFSTFILKTTRLKSPSIEGVQYPFSIKCDNASLWFDYSNVLNKGAIKFRCAFEKPMFLTSPKSKKEKGLIDVFQDLISSLLIKTEGYLYDYIFCELIMYEKTAEILEFKAYSKDIIMSAEGKATSDGKMDIALRTFFSPAFTAKFPNEAKMILEEESNGWFSFRIEIKMDEKNPVFLLESDTFRLSIESYEEK